jgi:dTDP-4-amino-4,6-dideoxygalactose transaminase
MTPVPFFDLRQQYAPLREAVRAAVDRVLDSQMCIGGPEVEGFEARVERLCQGGHATACSNGSDALVLALKACGVGPGDEVIVPAFTFFATAGSVALCGARPVFADIDLDSFNLDADHVASLIGANTRAIIPVDLFGQPADLDAFTALAKRHGLHIIEDAAQAIGSHYKGRPVGGQSELTTFSFYPTKNLGGCGEGGLVMCRDGDRAEHIKQLRNHGQSSRYEHATLGMNGRLDALQAAILRVKIEHLESWTRAREHHAARYREQLASLPELTLPAVSATTSRHVYNQFVLRVEKRDALRDALTERGVGTGVYYPLALHHQACFAPHIEAPIERPQSDRCCREVLALPIFPELTDEQVDRVCAAMKESLAAI